MIKPEQIPDEAKAAARKAYFNSPHLSWQDAIDVACVAMVNAWPGGIIGTAAVASNEAGEPTYRDKAFLLPLPPEKVNR
jgi:hypothetical protein